MKQLAIIFISLLPINVFALECESIITREMAIEVADEVVTPDIGKMKMELFFAKCYRSEEKDPGIWFVGYVCATEDNTWRPSCETTVSISNEENPLVNGRPRITKQSTGLR